MANDKFETDGIVVDVNKGLRFKVKLLDNDMIIDCVISGKMRMNKIHIVAGDKVTVAISPYDLKRGMIIWRYS